MISEPVVKTLTLDRDDRDAIRTFGQFVEDGKPIVQTMELPWRGNEHNVSCIPPGTYPVRWMWSQRHLKFLYHICEVPNRDVIEIHIGNYVADTQGCILVGQTRGANVIWESRVALAKFHEHMNGATAFTLIVTDPTNKRNS